MLTIFMEKEKKTKPLISWHLRLYFPHFPFFDYSFSVSICKCSLLPTLEADVTQHSILFLCSFYTALMPIDKPTTRKSPPLSSGLNIHVPPVFQIQLGAAQARYGWFLLSSSSCTIWFLLLRSPCEQVASPSILWPLVETSVPLMQMT